MDREIQELLHNLQKFSNMAVEALQAGNKEKSAFWFRIASGITNQLSDKIEK